jgi:ATP-binding cassette subfamily F protein 3
MSRQLHFARTLNRGPAFPLESVPSARGGSLSRARSVNFESVMISLSSVAKHFGERTLFSGVSVTIGISERIGLVGANGSGKSTILEILAGRMEPDEGTVARNRRATIGYLAQEVPKHTGRTLMEEMLAGHAHLDHLKSRIALVEEEMRATTDAALLESLAHEHGELERRFDAGGGYDLPAQAKKILGGLAFRDSDFDRATSEFSGGWLMRLALARLLLVEPDLLLLDEPTNYLDLESVIWLESYLREYDGSIIVVSHDRVLLNTLSQRILEIDGGKLTSYTGNYDGYQRLRALREEGLEAARKQQERQIAHAEKFIERFRYKNTKARQVQSRIKALERMERIDAPSRRKTMRLAFPDAPPSSRQLIQLRGVWKGYGGNIVYQGIDLAIERGERVALVGPNGAGKSTLLKLLAGAIEPDEGERALGRGAILAYYAQHQVEALDFRRTILEEVCAAAPNLTQERVRGLLGRFLFSGDDVMKTIGILSGGEKARVALAKLLVNPPNLILLDEPTSHLDIPSRDILVEALEEYDGSLVMISHDRHFLSALANRVVEVGAGGIRSFLGDYGDYAAKKAQEERDRMRATAGDGAPPRGRDTAGEERGATTSGASIGGVATASGARDAEEVRQRRTKEDRRREAEIRNERYRALTPVKREIEGLEAELDRLTKQASQLEAEMASPSFYQDGSRFGETLKTYNALKSVIDAKTHRWEELSLRLEEMERRFAAES